MYFCPKQGQDFKPPAAPLYPNMGQVPPPPGAPLDTKNLSQMPLLNCTELVDVVSIQCPGFTTVCQEWRQTLDIDFQLCRERKVVGVKDTFTEPTVRR